MKRIWCVLMLSAVSAALLPAAETTPSVIGKVMDNNLKEVESEFVPLVEAMPADKMNFAPSGGEFTGVRTFIEQAKHVAAVLYLVSASILEEAPPAEAGTSEAGPASVTTKDQAVAYVKGAFAYAHKAMGSLTDKNATALVKSPFGSNQTPKLNMASITTWHSYDHYGQMVVYLRMNGIVPPASRK
jgi:hypothetical protein